MENLFQKMGLYDIWTVLFPGTIFLVGGRALYDFMASLDQILSTTPHAVGKIGLIFQLHIAIPTDIYELLALLVLSYFWGGILHELSSIMKHKWLYKNGEPSARLLDEKAGILNKQEICRLMPLLKTLNNGRDFSESEPDKLKDESKYTCLGIFYIKGKGAAAFINNHLVVIEDEVREFLLSKIGKTKEKDADFFENHPVFANFYPDKRKRSIRNLKNLWYQQERIQKNRLYLHYWNINLF